MRGPAIPFLVLGVAFIAIGISGNRAFTTIGLVFLVLGFVKLARARGKRRV
jgi:membrane-bound ClpP family serine protease